MKVHFIKEIIILEVEIAKKNILMAFNKFLRMRLETRQSVTLYLLDRGKGKTKVNKCPQK